MNPSKESILPTLLRSSSLAIGLCVVAAAAIFLVTAWMADDAYITLRTVRNVLEGHGPVYNVGERVQAYTHPLWFLLLVTTSAISREMYLTPILLGVLLSLLTIALLLVKGNDASQADGTSPRNIGWALAGAVLLLSSRSFVDYSTSGLENPLSHLLVLGFFLILAGVLEGRRVSAPADQVLNGERSVAPDRGPILLGLSTGLILLNRVDLGLLLAPGLLAVLWRLRHAQNRARRAVVTGLAVGVFPFVIWEVFSLIYYGSLVPNTALAKLQSGIPGDELAQQGLRYFENSLRVDPLTVPLVGLALLLLLLRRRVWDVVTAAGIVLYLIYVVRIGGDFMSGRFFSTVLVVSVLAIVRVLPSLATRPAPSALPDPIHETEEGDEEGHDAGEAVRAAPFLPWTASVPLPFLEGPRLPAAVLLLAIGAASLIFATPRPPQFFARDFGIDKIGALDDNGISDERRFYFAQTGLINGKPLRDKPGSHAYEVQGHAARRSEAPVLPEGMIGVRGFQARADIHVIDVHALSDPLLARLPSVRHDPQYEVFRRGLDLPPSRQGWRIGHFLRNVPRGYLATVLTGNAHIEDPEIAALYDEVRSLVSGPIFSKERWTAIGGALVGGMSGSGPRPEYEAIDYSELLAYAPDVPEYLFRRAQAEYAKGNFAAAEKDAERATQLDALYTPALTQLALIHARAGDLKRAAGLLERVRNADPKDAQSRIDLGDLYLQEGGAERAREVYEEALLLEPTQPAKFYNSLGVAQALSGDEPAARASFARALELAPLQPEAYDNLAQLAIARGETAKALALYERVLELEADPGVLFNAGIAFMEADRMTDAVRTLERAWAADRGSATIAYHLAHASSAVGNDARAVEMLRAAAQLGHEDAQREIASASARD